MATPTTLPATFVAGNVLTAAQMNDLRGAFRVLQIVRATDTNNRSTTSAFPTYVDANLSVTITPQSTSSNILIVSTFQALIISTTNNGGLRGLYQITDGSNNALSGAEQCTVGPLNFTNTTGYFYQYTTISAFHSPNSTSARTYKLRFCRPDANSTVYTQGAEADSQIIAYEISA